DPKQISYEKLLEVFWSSHNPCEAAGSRQYLSAVFYHNDAQRQLAEQTRQQQQARRGQKILTPVLPLGVFYLAEDYHQKFYLRQSAPLLKEFRDIYPDEAGFRNSTAATRVNAYLGGYGRYATLEMLIDRLGLSPNGRRMLLALVKDRR